MKANNGSGNNESRDMWETPIIMFELLDKEYGFNFDCCANKNNSKCWQWSEDFENERLITETAWMNPPFSKAHDMFIHFFKSVKKGVAIYRCDNMETKIWQEVILLNADWIFIPNKRIAYEGMNGSGSRFPSALIGFNVKEPKGLKGTLLQITKQGGLK